MSSNYIYDTIVVGIGGIGSATCFELGRRGQRVLGLEKYDIPHSFGSSHGHTRIIRKAYFEGPTYVPLLHRAYELWQEIEEIHEEQLLFVHGGLDIGTEDSEVFSGSVASCTVHQLPHEILTPEEVHYRFPGYRIPENYKANYSAQGGFLTPEKAICAFVAAAHRYDVTIKAREAVSTWRTEKDGVIVKTAKETYHAKKLIFTSGAWSYKMLPFLNKLAVPERQVLAWLQPIEERIFLPDVFPVFVLDDGIDQFYGFPIHDVPGFKFGKFRHRYENCDPDNYDRLPNEKDEALLRTFANDFFPKGNGPTMSLKTCMFTNSPDGHFIIDRHPEFEQVSFAAGFSGHGFKFASVMGEIMAELSINGESRHDLQGFGLARFDT